MDGGIDLSSLLSAAGSSDAISNAMNILMKKPELIEMVANELGLSDGGQKDAENNEAPGADSATKNTNKVPSKEKTETENDFCLRSSRISARGGNLLST